MIKRITAIALFTGSAQVLSLIAVGYVLRNLGERTSGLVGIIDSTVLVIAGIVSFGIQLAVNRNAVLQKSWRSNYQLAQSSRFSISSLVLLFGVGAYFLNWDKTNLIFLVAPFVAFNGDYALYGNGLPVKAAMLSFFRVSIPYLGLLLLAYFGREDLLDIYMMLVALGIFIAGFFASRFNEVSYVFPFNRSFLKFYYKYYKVGIYQLSWALLVTGVLTLAKPFYTLETIGLVYGILKYFEVFKGVLRIIVQAFFKELSQPEVAFKIDKVGLMIGGFIVIPAFLFMGQTLELLFGTTYAGRELILVLFGVAMLIASFKTSTDIRTLLIRKDDVNLKAFTIALGATFIALIAFSKFGEPVYGIPASLIIGESILLLVLGFNQNESFFKPRFLFFSKLLPLLVPALLIRLLLGSSVIYLVASAAIYILLIVVIYRKLIFGSVAVRN